MHSTSSISRSRLDPATASVVEQQMARWLARQELQHRCVRSSKQTVRSGPCIAVSREAGSGGEPIARAVGEALGWSVLDKEILDQVAERLHCASADLAMLDERPPHWLHGMLHWFDDSLVEHEKYVHGLVTVIRAAGARGNVVLVGRGAACLVSRRGSLNVRLVASPGYRIERVMNAQDCDYQAARRWVEQTDRRRRDFVQRHFHHDPGDPRLYDMILDVEHLGESGTVERIVEAARRQFD